MDLLVKYNQEKKDRNKSKSISKCDLQLYKDDEHIYFENIIEFDYDKGQTKKLITFKHHFEFNFINGDFETRYTIINDGLTNEKMFRNLTNVKRNNFKMLFDCIENGLVRCEKRNNFWGVKYKRIVDEIEDTIIKFLQPKLDDNFYSVKDYKHKSTLYPLYCLFVDYHLHNKKIKGHDGIYYDIQNEYPKKKWLEKNDHKFLPAVLDSYGIKSKYLIGELNKNSTKPIQISSLNYLCKLFGNNYVSYLKKIVWELHCYEVPPNKKTHELKSEFEKNCLINCINKWEKETLKSDSLVYSLNKLFSIRELLESRGLNLKFKAKNDNEFDNIMELWSGYRLHFARGYKVKYLLPDEFINEIENDIVLEDNNFKIKILTTEDDFRVEGFNMKNCMSKQFPHGALYIFISMQLKRKKINLQYRKGNLIQSYGKANTPVNKIFEEAISILNKKFEKYTNLSWSKVKYDFLTNSLSIS